MATPLRILIADDEPDLLELLEVNLSVEGHDVRMACNGTQALEMALAERPDLVILDVMMPGLDGLEVLRALRLEPGYSDMPIVLLSARGSDPEIFEGWRSGANYYITKPFQIEELLEFIGQVQVQLQDDALPDEDDITLDKPDGAVGGGASDFDAARQTSEDEQRELELDLHSALAAGEFFLVYQPSFDLRNLSINGVEALLRWRHPVLGTVQPVDFIPILERTGLMANVGRWVLEDACRQTSTWRLRGYELTVSVNISPSQLESDDLVADTQSALTRSGLLPGSLVIDVPEKALTADVATSSRRLAALKALGVRIAIDDFGSSQQSMAHLKQLAVDVLKIDRSFMPGIVDSPERASLMHTLIQVAKTLGIEAMAKGIEHQDQLLHLQRERCDTGQGFIFGHALDVDGVTDLLNTWAHRAESTLTPPTDDAVTVLPAFG